jgi:N-acetylglucosamine kinase
VPVAGGLSNSERLVAALDAAVRARILRRTAEPLVVRSVLGADAGLIGASLL